MKSATAMLFCAGAALGLSAPASAHWMAGDDHKMHFPQLPDLTGYDVCGVAPQVLADDWQCSATGPVTDVHLWGSWAFDMPGIILSVHLSIHENIPAGTGGPDFSRPGAVLWQRDFTPNQFTIIDPDMEGDQSWYDPGEDEVRYMDHRAVNQINIVDIADPFIQTRGDIYWLDVSATVDDMGTPGTYRWGWKTSQDHFMDAAVWSTLEMPEWSPLSDPMDMTQPFDMAFVITPTPGSAALLGLAGVAVLYAHRRR